MNRSVFESSPVQQMMAGNPNWWSNMRAPPQLPSPPPPPPPNLFPPPSSYSSLLLPLASPWVDQNQELPESWSQLLLGGFVGEDQEKCGLMSKKLENWEEQLLMNQDPNGCGGVVDIKQENNSGTSFVYSSHEEFEAAKQGANWAQMMHQVSSPKSCVTTSTLSSNMLDFSSKKDGRHPPPDRLSECNSTANGGTPKKARVQNSSTQSTFKVRKEKLGDRITALHQMVSPFGKTDTASVLLEAIGYIRFLQSQIQALSSPYLGNGSPNMRQQQPVQGERSSLFPEEPGQDYHEEPKKDLRSRGLCLVPISCTLQVGSDNGADYWAPAIGGFR